MSRRRKTHDYMGTHEVDVIPWPLIKRFRGRVYESDEDIPVIVISDLDDPVHAITPDVERMAAEIVLRHFPERALRAKKRERFVHVVEHLPKSYDLWRAPENKSDRLALVEFGDWRIRVADRLRRVRNVQRALEENTRAGNKRVTFGYPSWHDVSKPEVEEMVGMTLDDIIDVSQRSLPNDLPDTDRSANVKAELG